MEDRNSTLVQGEIAKVSSRLLLQIILHGFLLWASMAFLLPVGILISRMSTGVTWGKRRKSLFYIHIVFQTSSVLLATIGAVLALRYFDNSFGNAHQRIGVVLYALIWMQPLIGLCRPQRGEKGRMIWFSVHWFMGMAASIIAIVNVYIGLEAYHARTSKSIRLWMVLFTIQVSVIAFVYILQDRWDYLRKQEVALPMPNEITAPAHVAATAQRQKR